MPKCWYCNQVVGEVCRSAAESQNCSLHQQAVIASALNQPYRKVEGQAVMLEQMAQQMQKEAKQLIPDTARARILMEAMDITHRDRNANYGNPEDNFKQIADLWNAYWTPKVKRLEDRDGFTPRFDAYDVAIMNALIKVARLSTNPNHHDSAVDIAGYAACLGDIQEKAARNLASPNKDSSAPGSGSILGGSVSKS